MKYMVLLSALLAGCTTASDVYLADGTKGHNISCPGAVRNYGDCLQKAGEVCGARGYEVVTREGSVGSVSTAAGSFSANQQYASGSAMGFGGTVHSRNILVRCK